MMAIGSLDCTRAAPMPQSGQGAGTIRRCVWRRPAVGPVRGTTDDGSRLPTGAQPPWCWPCSGEAGVWGWVGRVLICILIVLFWTAMITAIVLTIRYLAGPSKTAPGHVVTAV